MNHPTLKDLAETITTSVLGFAGIWVYCWLANDILTYGLWG